MWGDFLQAAFAKAMAAEGGPDPFDEVPSGIGHSE